MNHVMVQLRSWTEITNQSPEMSLGNTEGLPHVFIFYMVL